MTDKPFPLLTASQISAMKEKAHVHQFNDNAVRHTRSLSDELGLTTLGVHLVRLEPGTDSTEFHTHNRDEEFIYILSGEGTAEIGDETCNVRAGDFMAFAQHSLPHNLVNTSGQDLVYLMGGTRCDIDICDYPRIGKRMYRVAGKRQVAAMDDIHDVHKP